MADHSKPKLQDPSIFWKLQNVSSDYWTEYISTRPKYDSKVIEPLLEFHRLEPRAAALDIGSGSGCALGALIDHFSVVVATDNDPMSVAFAQERFSDVPSDRLSYVLSSGEELDQHFKSRSFDLITCAETFPLMDTE
jgi:methylase of polypeptide subunit release factors